MQSIRNESAANALMHARATRSDVPTWATPSRCTRKPAQSTQGPRVLAYLSAVRDAARFVGL